MRVIKRVETPISIRTLYEKDGYEMWHCYFKDDLHPVNKKLFKMSGAEREGDTTTTVL